jgi:type VI secretion system protein ImpA
MASPPVLDFEALCQPVSEENPAGLYLRSTPELEKLWWDFSDKLEQERSKEKRLLMGEDAGANRDSAPRWETVIDAGQNALASSKDLWVAAGMIEALVRKNQFTGLRDGFRLVRELTERFGASLHPPLDEEDAADTGIHTAFLRLDGVDASLPDVIRRLPIVHSSDSAAYSTFDHIRIVEGRGGDDTPAQLEAAARSTPTEFFHNLIEDIRQLLEEIEKLGAAADAACGMQDGYSLAPSFSRVKETVEDSLRRIRSLAGSEPESEGEAEDEAPAGAPAGTAAPAASGDVLNTREDAYRLLGKLVTFFDRTEPHSPIATALRELTTWRTLSFVELMKRLIEDSSARRELFRRTGAPADEEE